jgi:peptidoglycan-associated lipoprotein
MPVRRCFHNITNPDREGLSPMKWIAISAALVLLAACGSTPDEQVGLTPSGGAAAGAGIGQTGTDGIGTSRLGEAQPGSQEDLEVNVGDRVYFGFDSYQLDAQSQATLQRQAAWLRQFPNLTVTVEGHADERGTRDYNLALGDRRAQSARNYLVALGVEPNRVLTISYGKERPVDAGSNEEAWARNRRAVTVVNVGF